MSIPRASAYKTLTSFFEEVVETCHNTGKDNSEEPPESMVRHARDEGIASTYVRNVFTGMDGSSVFETAARTSAYGDSLCDN